MQPLPVDCVPQMSLIAKALLIKYLSVLLKDFDSKQVKVGMFGKTGVIYDMGMLHFFSLGETPLCW